MGPTTDRAGPDRGAGTFEWLGLGVLAAIIVVTLQLAGVGHVFSAGVSRTVCAMLTSCDIRPPRQKPITPPIDRPVPRPDPSPTGAKVHCHAIWRLPDGTYKHCS
ncbi:MAG TPA: hypothetical protein VGL93_17760 [Streptosporangiaceae bacterium]